MKVAGETKSTQTFRQKDRQESNIIIFLLFLFWFILGWFCKENLPSIAYIMSSLIDLGNKVQKNEED